MDRNRIFIGLAIFYTVFLGLMGYMSFDDVSSTSSDILTIEGEYTLNESTVTLTFCEIKNPIIGASYISCEDGETFKLEEVEVIENDDLIVYDSGGFISWISSRSEFADNVTTYIESMFTTISGLPSIVTLLIFTPLGIMVLWLLIDLFVWITPFIGGGS